MIYFSSCSIFICFVLVIIVLEKLAINQIHSSSSENFPNKAFRKEDYGGAKLLKPMYCAVAVLWLPESLHQVYVKALRTQEDYGKAEAVIFSLKENFPDHKWIELEELELKETKELRANADNAYRNNNPGASLELYGKCLRLNSKAGGRLAAVLHCNRAACLMSCGCYYEALEECEAALNIFPTYMKAIVRKARCWSYMEHWTAAIKEYQHWLQLIEEHRQAPAAHPNMCFEGPEFYVNDADASESVERELSAIVRQQQEGGRARRWPRGW